MSSTPTDWRASLVTKIQAAVTGVNVKETADIEAALKQVWTSPTIFVRLDDGTAGHSQSIWPIVQEYGARLQMYIAVRDTVVTGTDNPLEQAENKTLGVHDINQKLVVALSGYVVSAPGEQMAKIFLRSWRPYKAAAYVVVLETTWEVLGNFIVS
jgi:hypothetical protein